jgi:hypothetical protein
VNRINTIRLIFLAISIHFTLANFPVHNAAAEIYYVAVNGADTSNGSFSAPWATFDHALNRLQPGDTLVIKDGIYYQSLIVSRSGRPGQPVTIEAENDGKAIIDGQGNRRPFHMSAAHLGDRNARVTDINITGIQFRNSSASVFGITKADRITVRRVSAYHAGGGNHHVFSVNNITDSLIEDCAASGSGRGMFYTHPGTRVTFRRCWGRWQRHTGVGGPNSNLILYGANDCLVENCIGTKDPAASGSVQGMGPWANTGDASADRNRFFGNVVHDLEGWAYLNSSALHRTEGNRFENNIAINTLHGLIQAADADCRIENITIVNASRQQISVTPYGSLLANSDVILKSDIRNSIFYSGDLGLYVNNTGRVTSWANQYNDHFALNRPYGGAASPGVGDRNIDPGYKVSDYGKGAYLFIPADSPVKRAGEGGKQMGAEVLYRYQDGQLTDIPLWSWPMEERIFSETGVSVTWEANGGLWKTLDGVYATGTQDKPPTAPTNLKIKNSSLNEL